MFSNDNDGSRKVADNEKFISEAKLAQRHGVSKKKLQKDRRLHVGVPFPHFGRMVRYAMSDVLAYEADARR